MSCPGLYNRWVPLICRRGYSHWHSSQVISDRRSQFQGHAIKVESEDAATQCLEELIASNKKLSKASHTITALRIKNKDGVLNEKFKNGGEPPSGERILDVLRQNDIENAFIVVHRWYGGKQLGGDRFVHILHCARQAIELAGMTKSAKND